MTEDPQQQDREDQTFFGRMDVVPVDDDPESVDHKGRTSEDGDAVPIYRTKAVRHAMAVGHADGVLKVVPTWAGGVVWGWACVLLVGLVSSVVIRIEEKVPTRGVVRPDAGWRPVLSLVGGRVMDVAVKEGGTIREGDPVMTIASGEMASRTVEAGENLRDKTKQIMGRASAFRVAAATKDALIAERIVRGTAIVTSLEGSLKLLENKLDAERRLAKEGLVSQVGVSEAQDAVERGKRDVEGARQNLAQLKSEAAGLRAERTETETKLAEELGQASLKDGSAKLAAGDGVVKSTVAGRVDAVFVAPGDTVVAGQKVAVVASARTHRTLVAFIPEIHRASIKVGDRVYLEFGHRPKDEWGMGVGHITRIAEGVADVDVIKDTIGSQSVADVARVMVTVEVDSCPGGGVPPNGAQVSVHFVTSRRRLIAFIFPPLARIER